MPEAAKLSEDVYCTAVIRRIMDVSFRLNFGILKSSYDFAKAAMTPGNWVKKH